MNRWVAVGNRVQDRRRDQVPNKLYLCCPFYVWKNLEDRFGGLTDKWNWRSASSTRCIASPKRRKNHVRWEGCGARGLGGAWQDQVLLRSSATWVLGNYFLTIIEPCPASRTIVAFHIRSQNTKRFLLESYLQPVRFFDPTGWWDGKGSERCGCHWHWWELPGSSFCLHCAANR